MINPGEIRFFQGFTADILLYFVLYIDDTGSSGTYISVTSSFHMKRKLTFEFVEFSTKSIESAQSIC